MIQKIAELNHADVTAARKRFMAINRDRLMRTHATLRERQSDFLEILPLLFHTNHPTLPGFVSKDTPAGVSEYRPSDRSIAAAKRLSKTFSMTRRALLRYDIFALYLMGSSGTIAYSKKSDFDIWICHGKDLTAKQLDELRQKAQAIEQWAATFDLEVHFFLVEAESFSKGVHEDMSAESSGSAQHYLLMEEFYRTGLLLAGCYPLWWLVPPDREHEYVACVQELRRKRYVMDGECIDFGAMPMVPAEEFFGAALWQLYKGIDSPYKSVLKLLMMEVYTSEYPNGDLLCHRFKKAIYGGAISLDELDPYIMLYKKIEEHLVSRGEDERLELVRRCFYFKVAEPLSVKPKRNDDNWRRELMLRITQSWAWSAEYLEMLDSRDTWKIERVMKERVVLVKALTFSYQFLSDFGREHAQLARINQRDLNILGRKLYAAFERKAGKVEIVNHGISSNVWESHLTFYRAHGGREPDTWHLFNAPLNITDARRERPLKRSHSLVELLTWCHFNNMLDGNTVLAMHSQESAMTPRELKEMLFAFQKLFPLEKMLKAETEDFAQPSQAAQIALFVNLGMDPIAEYARQGKHLMTNKTDPLCYGGVGENLVLSFDVVTVTTWKEVLVNHFEGIDGLFASLREYLRWSVQGRDSSPPPLSAQCFSFGRGGSIKQRMEELFADVAKCFFGKPDGIFARYVLAIEQTYYALSIDKGTLVHEPAATTAALAALLSEANENFRTVVIDRYALAGSALAAIFPANRAGVVQLFFMAVGDATDVYILDERGSLFFQRMMFVDRETVGGHFSAFLDSVHNRQYYEIAGGDEQATRDVQGVECFEIILQGADKPPALVAREIVRRRRPGEIRLQVIGEVRNDEQRLTIYCDDREFSTMEFGQELFNHVAQYILSKRRSGERYPIYITDLDLPHSMFDGHAGNGQVQTIHYLNYKRRIEKQLNEAMQLQPVLATLA